MLTNLLLMLNLTTTSPVASLHDYYNGRRTDLTPVQIQSAADAGIASANSYDNAVGHFIAGHSHATSGHPLNATLEYHKALTALQSCDTSDLYLQISIRKNLGSIFDDFGQFEKAIQYYQTAIPFAQDYSKAELASIYTNMGNTYRSVQDAKLMLEMYFKAQDLYRSLDDHYNLARLDNKIGLAFYAADAYDTAEYFFNNAIFDHGQHLRDKQRRIIGQAYHNLGQAYFKQLDFIKSAHAFHQALEYKSDSEKYITFLDLGELYLTTEDLDSAGLMLARARAIYSGSTNVDHSMLWQHLATLEIKRGDLSKAIKFQDTLASVYLEYANTQRDIKNTYAASYADTLYLEYLDNEAQKIRNRLVLLVSLICGLISVYILIRWRWKKNGIRAIYQKLNSKYTWN